MRSGLQRGNYILQGYNFVMAGNSKVHSTHDALGVTVYGAYSPFPKKEKRKKVHGTVMTKISHPSFCVP